LISNFKKSPSKVFIGLSSFQLLAMFRRGLFYTYLSIYFKFFLKLSVTETTLYATLPMLMSILFQNFIWGPLSDKIQRRRFLIILGETIAGIGTLIVWLIHLNFSNLYLAGYVIIIGLTVIEMFWSMSNIGWTALVSDLYPFKNRSRIMGNLTSIGGLGRIIGISIGGFLYDNGLGFRHGSLFFVSSFVMFISTLPMLIFTPEGGINHNIKKELESKPPTKLNNSQRDMKTYIIFIISLTFINFGINSIAVTFPQYLKLDSGFSVSDLTLSFIANTRSISTIIFGFSAGFLSKKIGHGRTLMLGTFFGIFALFIIATTFSLPFIFIGNFLFGVSEVIIYASSYAFASILISERRRAKLFGIYNATFFLSWGLACTLISAPLIDILISQGQTEVLAYQWSFIVGAIMCSIGLLIFIILDIWLKTKKENKKYR
jgi:MFS family permease